MDSKYKSSFQSGHHMERCYQQALEEEQNSLARNKKLLEDIDRLEQQMKNFHHECKQDEDKLNRAKNKFMRYVKSVYPKWTEDVRKWHEAKEHRQNEDKFDDSINRSDRNRATVNYPQSDLHSMPNRNYHSFTDSERSPSDAVLFKEYSHENLLGFPKDRIKNPRDNIGQDLGYARDIMGSHRDRIGYPKHAVGSPSDMIGYPRDMMGYPSDRMMSSMGYSRDYSRAAMEHTRDDIGLSRNTMGYSRNDNGYPRDSMYNGRPWMYQHSSPGMFPHTAHPYFLPVPAYGVPRWSTPGYKYDQWSMSNPHERSYHEEFGDRQGFSEKHKERAQDVSFEKDENGQKSQLHTKESLPNARNGEHYPSQRNSRDINSLHKDFTGHLSAEDLLEDERYPAKHLNKTSADATRQFQDPGQGLGRSDQESDDHRITRDRGSYKKNVDSKALPQRNGPDDSRVKGEKENHEVRPRYNAEVPSQGEDRELSKGRERSRDSEKVKRQPRRKGGAVNSPVEEHSSNIGDERHIPRGHKFHDGSFNEELTDHTTNSERFDSSKQNKSDGGDYVGEPKKGIRVMQLRSEGSGFGAMDSDSISLPTIHQYEGDIRDVFSDISSSEPLNQGGSSRADVRRSEARDASQVIAAAGSKGKGLLTREASESKPNAVEDLIGDDVSDFEVSEADVSEDELGERGPLSSTAVSGNVLEDSASGHEISDTSPGDVRNETAVKDKTGASGLNHESIAQHGQNDLRNEGMTGDKGTGKNSFSNEKIRRHEEEGKSLHHLRKETKEVSEPGKDTSKEDVVSHGRGDVSISEELHNDTSDSGRKRQAESKIEKDTENTGGRMKVDLERHPSEHQKIAERNSSINAENDLVLKEGLLPESGDVGLTAKDVKTGEGVDKESEVRDMIEDQSIEEKIAEDIHENTDDGELVSEDEKSKSGVLEEISFSSAESSSESAPVQEKKTSSKKSEAKTKESVSYSEDFEDERSIPLTQSAAYQKMLSTVDVSDEGEDIEEDFLEGTMSEANTTGQSAHNMPQTFQDSGTPSQLPAAKTSKSKPTLSLFNSGERGDFGNSLGKESEGVLSASWKSSERSLSPPLSPDAGGYVPSVLGAVEDREVGKEKGVSPVEEAKDVKSQAKPHESNTKSRIQAGFWNQSDSESEVDLQISHGGGNDNNDDDDDFDFYS